MTVENAPGVVYSTGVLAERYEYTPYGKRTVYSRGWILADIDDDGAVGASDDAIMDGVYNTTNPTHRADLNGDGKIDIDDVTIFNPAYGSSIAANDPLVHHPRHGSFRGRSSAGNPTPLCEAGHQGLLHDEEFDLVYNRARMLVPMQGRFGGRDPLEYAAATSLYESVGSNPTNVNDPAGMYPWGPNFNMAACTTYCGVKAPGAWWCAVQMCLQACNNECANEQARWLMQNLPPVNWVDPNGVLGTDPYPSHPCC